MKGNYKIRKDKLHKNKTSIIFLYSTSVRMPLIKILTNSVRNGILAKKERNKNDDNSCKDNPLRPKDETLNKERQIRWERIK